MATTIVSRVIDSITDKRVRLSNSEIARAIDVGTGWNSMRIGIRLSALPEGEDLDIPGFPRLNIGVSAGTDDTIGAQTPQHFVGVRSNSATWQFAGTDPNNIYRTLAEEINWQFFKNVDGSEIHNTAAPLASISAEATGGSRSAIFLDINKNATGAFDFHFYGPDDAAADEDISLTDFFTVMDTPSLVDASLLTYTHDSGNAGGVPVDEGADGSLNSLNIYWDRTVQQIEISDVAFSILN